MNIEAILSPEELESLIHALRGEEQEPKETFHYHIFTAYAQREESQRQEYVCFAVPADSRHDLFWEKVDTPGSEHTSTPEKHTPTLENIYNSLDLLAEKLAKYVATAIPSPPEGKEHKNPLISISFALPYHYALFADYVIGEVHLVGMEIAGWNLPSGDRYEIPEKYHVSFVGKVQQVYRLERDSTHHEFQRKIHDQIPAVESTDTSPEEAEAMARFDGEGGASGGK